MNKITNIEQCFDENGNFIKLKDGTFFDPFRCTPEYKELYDYLFDEDGCTKRDSEIVDLLHKKNWSWHCSAVQYYYSSMIDTGCHGNYTAKYGWR